MTNATKTPLDFVAAAVASIARNGFKKTAEAFSTRSDCNLILSREAGHPSKPTLEQINLAEKMIAWCDASKDTSEYMLSLREAVVQRVIKNSREEGLLASLPSAYDRAQKWVPRQLSTAHFGTVGERYDLEVSVLFARPFVGEYGGGTIVVMKDAAGHVFKWFASSNLGNELNGKFYLRATVKGHTSDNRSGEPVTMVTRGKLEREPFKPAKAKRAAAA